MDALCTQWKEIVGVWAPLVQGDALLWCGKVIAFVLTPKKKKKELSQQSPALMAASRGCVVMKDLSHESGTDILLFQA